MDFFLMSQDMDFQNIVSIRREEIPETWRSTRGIERRHYPSAKDFLGKNCNILVESNRQNLYPDFFGIPGSPVIDNIERRIHQLCAWTAL